MTIDQLEMLETIVEKGSFKAASEALNKTQPSLSVAIKKLEQEFDVKLFDRSAYRPRLTEEGRAFYARAKETLRSFRRLETLGHELSDQKTEPRLEIVLDPLVRFEPLKTLFDTCLSESGPTELVLHSEILGGGMDRVLANEAHFAVGPKIRTDERIESVPFETLELVPVISAKCGDRVSRRDRSWLLEQTQIVVIRDESPEPAGSAFGVMDGGRKCFVTDHSLKRRLIREGFGWGRLARAEIAADLKQKRLSVLEVEGVETLRLEFHVMRRRDRPMGPVARRLWEAWTQEMRASSAPKE